MNGGILHIHKRKRVHQKLEKYPHPDKFKRVLDKILLVVAVVGPLMSLPQIIKIYYYHNAASISTITFSSFILFNILWLTYGIVHKEKPIIIAYILWMISNISIVIGSLIY
jgi:uncharacterized protein with PQ loop repeat